MPESKFNEQLLRTVRQLRMALLMQPCIFSLYNFDFLSTVFSVNRESLALGSKGLKTSWHKAIVANLLSPVTEMLYLAIHTAMTLCFTLQCILQCLDAFPPRLSVPGPAGAPAV